MFPTPLPEEPPEVMLQRLLPKAVLERLLPKAMLQLPPQTSPALSRARQRFLQPSRLLHQERP